MNNPYILVIFFIIIVLFFIIFMTNEFVIYNKTYENFVPRFSDAPECQKYVKEYDNCNTFIDTVYNGGIERTSNVLHCVDMCYKDSVYYSV